MPVFEYVATDATSEVVSGTLAADTPIAARQALRERGLRIRAFEPARLGRAAQWSLPRRTSRRSAQVAEAARYLALLLRSGVALTEALDVLARQHGQALATVLKEVRDRITAGTSFADALQGHPAWFDGLFVSGVRVGEHSGNLEQALEQLSDYLQNRQKLTSELFSAITYPLILVAVGSGVVVFLTTRVVPQLLAVLEASGRSLPRSTVLLKSVSDLLVGHWIIALGITVTLVVGLTTLIRTTKGQRIAYRALLRVPVVAGLIRKSLVAQFAQRLSVLLSTGIPFVDALRLTRRVSKNALLNDELALIERSVEAGADIDDAMHDSKVFPPVVVHLVGVGQNTGELPTMLGELRTSYEAEVRIALTRFTALLEPLLIVVLAAVVGFVVFACLMPILEATRVIAQ